jgi:class 3 adenylate cyclase/tetratricopeptide (TPR) repeat protein
MTPNTTVPTPRKLRDTIQEVVQALDLRELGVPGVPQVRLRIGLAKGSLLLTNVGNDRRRIALALGNILDTTEAMTNLARPGTIRLDVRMHTAVAAHAQAEQHPDHSATLIRMFEPSDIRTVPNASPPTTLDELIPQIIALSAYVPVHVAAALVATPRAVPGHGEQRYVVTLFTHLSGLHTLAEAVWQNAPGVAAQAANHVFCGLLAIVEGFGGALARVDTYPTGHKVLALFGAPVSYEQSVERALLAALELREALPRMQSELLSLLALKADASSALARAVRGLTVRSGLNAGVVVAGLVGSPVRYEYTVMGDAVNTSARLMSSAGAGEVLVGANVYSMSRSTLEADERRLRIKGKDKPVSAWFVRAIRLEPPNTVRLRTPLVGRDAECKLLSARCDGLRAGQSSLIVLRGEAGIGKSRLVAELPQFVGSDGLTLQAGSPGLVPSTYSLVRALLGELGRLMLECVPPQVAERDHLLTERLCAAIAAEVWQALSVLHSAGAASQSSYGATGASQHRLLAWGLQSLIEGAAGERPVVCVCEDLHEADDASLEVMSYLLASTWRAPVLLCLTIRKTATSTTVSEKLLAASEQFQGEVVTVELGGLHEEAGHALTEALLPGLALEARTALQRHAAGNPLFLHTLTQIVQQQRLLASSSQGLVLRGALAELDVPRTLRELVGAQVDRLPAELRRLAQVAAVLAMVDRRVPHWLLERIVDEPLVLPARIRALEQTGVVVADGGGTTQHSVFHHALYQQAAYEQLLERERQELHRRAALVLCAHDADERAANVAALAYHCYEGREWELAAKYCLEAGQQALRAYANRDARRLLRRAQGLARRLGQAQQEAAAREALGELYAHLGRYTPARAQLMRALSQSQLPGERAEGIEMRARRRRLLALVAERMGEYDVAERECRYGLSEFADLSAPTIEVARMYCELAEVQWRKGDLVAVETTCRTGLAFVGEGERWARERALMMQRLAMVEGQRGSYAVAIQELDHCLMVARKVGEPALIAQILHNKGVYLLLYGSIADALKCFEESLVLKERIGDTVGKIRTIENIGVVYLNLGQYEKATNYLQECLDLCLRLNLPQPLANLTGNLGHLCYIQGDLDAARHHLERAHELNAALEDLDGLADTFYRLGDVALAQGQPEEAHEHAQQALAYAQKIQSQASMSSALRVMGEALIELDNLADAAEALERALRLQEQVDSPYDLTLLLGTHARLASAQGQKQVALSRAVQALDLAYSQKEPFLIAKMQRLQQHLTTCQ